MTFTPRDFQQADLDYLAERNYTGLLSIEPGGGKGHPLDEPVLTPSGWVKVGDLAVGDSVIGSDGKPTTVIGVFDRGVLPTYRVTFRDGASVRVDGDHLWRAKWIANGSVEKWRTVETRHLAGLKAWDTYEIPTTASHHPEADLPVDPYALGALIADGYLSGSGLQWTKNNPEVVEEMRAAVARSGGELRPRKSNPELQHGVAGMTAKLKALGLRVKSREKRIPREYFISSVEQREALVNGLFDGDGSVRKDRGTAAYTTTGQGLAEDVRALLWSLGVGATMYQKNHPKGSYWIVSVHGDFNPFRKDPNRHLVTGTTRTLRRSFKNIELIGEEEVRCIKVSAEDQLYVTKDYIVTHNTPLSLFAAKDAGADQTLVIAPKNTFRKTWLKTVPHIQGYEARVIGNGLKAERQALTDMEWGMPGVYLVTPNLFTRADISMWKPDMLIVDEVHQINKPGGKGQKKLSGFSSRDEPISLQVGASLTLSGTPVRAAFERAWSICRLHWPHLDKRGQVAYANHYGWLAERMTSKKMVVGRNKDGSLKYATEWLAERDQGRLFAELPSLVQHFRREACCIFHPEGFLETEEPNEVERIVELSPAQKRIISEIEDQGLAWIEDNPFVVDLPMTVQQRIRQVCLGVPVVVETGELDEFGFPKTTLEFPEDTQSTFIDETFNILEQLGEEPVVIYLSSQKFARVLTKRLNDAGVSAFEYSGKTSKTRDDDLDGFGTKYRVLVGSVSAVGTGTDSLQDVAASEIWLEVPLDDVDTVQSHARLDRLGQTKQVQRFLVHDDLGYSQGMFSKKLAKRLEVAKSTRVAV